METIRDIFISLLKILINNKNGIYFLLVLFVVLSIAGSKIKIRILTSVIRFISIIVLIFIFLVVYFRFGPAISDYLKKYNTSSKPSTPTQKPATKSTPSAPSTPKQQTAPSQPSYQAPKQLYYSVGCSNCYNSGCPRNGYSYSGYDAASWSYYKTLCQECGCADFKSYSVWR